MRISSAALDLVASVELHAHKPAEVVRAETGRGALDVNAEIERLVQRGVVIKAPFLDPFRLGLNCYAIGFQVIDEFAAEKYLPLVVRAEQVVWVHRHHAPGEYTMGIAAPSLAHVVDLFDDLLIGLRNAVARRYFMVIESFVFFGHKELGAASIERIPLAAMTTHDAAELEDFDRRLVAALGARKHFDAAMIARELRAADQAVAGGIERLRRAGVIRGFTYRFNLDAFGRRRYAILIRRRTVDLRLKRRFTQFVEAHRLVAGLMNFIGEWDHEVYLDVEHVEECRAFLRELRAEFGRDIERVRWAEEVETLKSTNLAL